MFSETEVGVLSKDLGAFRYLATTHSNGLSALINNHEKLLADYKALLNDYEETKDARDRYKKQARSGVVHFPPAIFMAVCAYQIQEGTPFVVVLIDGDNYPFDDALVSKGAEGGTHAAHLLFAAFLDQVRKMGLGPETRLVLRYIVNLAAASRSFHQLKLTGSHSRSLATFTAAFSSTYPLFDVIDAGDKPNATTSAKIKENFDLYVHTGACKHVFFAACNEQRNLDLLKPYERRSERITLVRNPQSWPQFSALGLRTEDYPGIFRESRPPSPDRSSSNLSGKPAKYVPPSQRMQKDRASTDVLVANGATGRHGTPHCNGQPLHQPVDAATEIPLQSQTLRPSDQVGADSAAQVLDDGQRTPRPRRAELVDVSQQSVQDHFEDRSTSQGQSNFTWSNQDESDRQEDSAQAWDEQSIASGRRSRQPDTRSNFENQPSEYESRRHTETFEAQENPWTTSNRQAPPLHDVSTTQQKRQTRSERPVYCTHWIRGLCKYSDTCIKLHEVPPDPRGPGILDNFGPRGRATMSKDWRAPESRAKVHGDDTSLDHSLPSLGQKGSTTRGRAYPHEEWGTMIDTDLIASSLPRRDGATKDMIPVNRVEWRLDYYPGEPPNKADMVAWQEKLASFEFEPCYDYHLHGKCKDGNYCSKDHSQLSSNLVDVMRWIAHESPCRLQGACRDRDCVLAHICYNPNCSNGKKFAGCRLPQALHLVDPNVADYVPAIIPQEELTEEDRMLAGQPVEVIEGDLLGVDEDIKPVDKQSMTARWAQNAPHPHQSEENTPTRTSSQDPALIPASDIEGERHSSRTPVLTQSGDGRDQWDPWLPSPTFRRSQPAVNTEASGVKHVSQSPGHQKYSFEAASSTEASDIGNSTYTEPSKVDREDDLELDQQPGQPYDRSEAATPRPIHVSGKQAMVPRQVLNSPRYKAQRGASQASEGATQHTTNINGQEERVPGHIDTPQAKQSWHEAPADSLAVQAEKTTDDVDDKSAGIPSLSASSQPASGEEEPFDDTETTMHSFATSGPASESVDKLFDTESKSPDLHASQPDTLSATPAGESLGDDKLSTGEAMSATLLSGKTPSKLSMTAADFVPGSAFVPRASQHVTSDSAVQSHDAAKPVGDEKAAIGSESRLDDGEAVPKAPWSPLAESKHAPKTQATPSVCGSAGGKESRSSKKSSKHSRSASSSTAVRGDHGKRDGLSSHAVHARDKNKKGQKNTKQSEDAAPIANTAASNGDGAGVGDEKAGSHTNWSTGNPQPDQTSDPYRPDQSQHHDWSQEDSQTAINSKSYGQHTRSDATGYGRGRGFAGHDGQHGGGYGRGGALDGGGQGQGSGLGLGVSSYHGFDIGDEESMYREEEEIFGTSAARGSQPKARGAWAEHVW